MIRNCGKLTSIGGITPKANENIHLRRASLNQKIIRENKIPK